MALHSFAATIGLALLTLALLPVFRSEQLWEEHVAPLVAGKVTAPTYAAATAAVDKIFTEHSAWLIAFACAFAIWEVSRAVRIVGLALNEITDQEENRPLWNRVLVSLLLAVVVIVCIGLATVAVLVVGRILGETGGPLRWLLSVLRWPVGAIFLGIAVGVVANFAPVRSHGARWASAGAAVTVVAWLVESALFAFYVARIGNYQSASGNLLLFLVLTGYLYISAIVFLVGMQLDEFLQEDYPEKTPHPRVLLRRVLDRA